MSEHAALLHEAPFCPAGARLYLAQSGLLRIWSCQSTTSLSRTAICRTVMRSPCIAALEPLSFSFAAVSSFTCVIFNRKECLHF